MALLLGMFAWPWANQQSSLFRDRFQQRGVLSMIAPGRFHRAGQRQSTCCSSKGIDAGHEVRANVFVANAEAGKIGVALSHQGQLETTPNGDRLVVMEHGRALRRHAGPARLPHPGIRPLCRQGGQQATRERERHPARSRDTTRPDPQSHPREPGRTGPGACSLPILAFNFVMIAIPLAYVNPRLGRYTPLVFAVLIYLTYSNMINLAQAWVRSGTLSFWMALWPIHVAGLPGRRGHVPIPAEPQPGRLARRASACAARTPRGAGREDPPGLPERYFGRLIYGVFAFILFAVLSLFVFFDLLNELESGAGRLAPRWWRSSTSCWKRPPGCTRCCRSRC